MGRGKSHAADASSSWSSGNTSSRSTFSQGYIDVERVLMGHMGSLSFQEVFLTLDEACALVELGKLVFEFREKEGYRRQGFPGPKNLDPPLCDALGKLENRLDRAMGDFSKGSHGKRMKPRMQAILIDRRCKPCRTISLGEEAIMSARYSTADVFNFFKMCGHNELTTSFHCASHAQGLNKGSDVVSQLCHSLEGMKAVESLLTESAGASGKEEVPMSVMLKTWCMDGTPVDQRFLLYVENGEVVEIRQRFEALCLEEMLDGGLVDESDAESGEEGESGSNVAGKRGYDTMTRRSARRGGAVQEEEADTTVSLSEEADAIPDIVAELADIMGRVASQVTSCLRAAYPNNRGMSTIAEVVLHNRKPVVSGFFDPKGGDVPSLECAPPSGVSVWQVPLTYGRNQEKEVRIRLRSVPMSKEEAEKHLWSRLPYSVAHELVLNSVELEGLSEEEDSNSEDSSAGSEAEEEEEEEGEKDHWRLSHRKRRKHGKKRKSKGSDCCSSSAVRYFVVFIMLSSLVLQFL